MAIPLPQGPADNWDDDFEFNQRNSRSDGPVSDVARESTTPLSKDRKNTLKRWTENGLPAPATPSKRPAEQPENWDDDFRDSTDSPARSRTRMPQPEADEPENWDEDFDEGEGQAPAHSSGRSSRIPRWGSSDEEDDYGLAASEEDRTVTSRMRGVRVPMSLDLAEEAPPPVPPLPSPLLANSPTPSVFSMPVSSSGHRDSITYSAASHVHLISGSGAPRSALALLPPSPPIHRERRRLRKKSRPPPNTSPGVYELEELPDDLGQALGQTPTTPERRASTSLEDAPADGQPPPATPGPSSSSGTGKTPLLSRIGSVGKKWGAVRKKRASTGPSEVALPEHHTEHEQDRGQGRGRDRVPVSRPQSVAGGMLPPPSTSPPAPSKGSWFFRGGGGGGPGPPPGAPVMLEHKTSMDRLLAMARLERTPPASPRRGKERSRDGHVSVESSQEANAGSIRVADGSNISSSALFFGTPKRKPSRPMSMSVQAPQLAPSSSQGSSSGSSWASSAARPYVPRYASYGHELGGRANMRTPSSRASSKQRSASASVEDVSRSDRSLTVREGRRERERTQHRRHVPDVPDQGPQTEHPKQERERELPKAKEGSRSFMGGMRRISLGGHKRTKSSVPPESQARKSFASGATTIRAEKEPAEETTPRPPSRIIRSSQDAPLLPPIELQPPSPPRVPEPIKHDLGGLFRSHPTLEPSRSHPALSSSRSATPLASRPSGEMIAPMSSAPSPLSSPTNPKLSSSPGQVASLGRATQPPKELENVGSSSVPRRNSLGDLKIPARISQAQVGLRRDLGMVREFAASIEQLRQLQQTYHSMVGEIQSVMYGNQPQGTHSRALTPTLFGLPKPPSRTRSNTNPAPSPTLQTPHDLILALHSIESKYQLSWECAELLIDLGSTPPDPTSAATSPLPEQPSTSTPVPMPDGRKSRERAITLAGDEPQPIIATPGTAGSPPLASPPGSAQWRASTGRHDLSTRQLLLLREMLNNPDSSVTMALESHLPIPEEEWSASGVNRAWRWGADAMGSTMTLPSEDGTQASGSGASGAVGVVGKKEKRRSGKLGMRGLRDMLKNLKKSYSENLPPSLSPVPASTTSVSEGSTNNTSAEYWPQSLVQRRRAKTSTGPESMKSTRERDRHPNSPYVTSMSLPRSSPRRPSLASIFRIVQKSRSQSASHELPSDDVRLSNPSSATSAGPSKLTEDDGEEDWDRVESASDLEAATRIMQGVAAADGTGAATVRGRLIKDKNKSPYLLQRQPHQRDRNGRPITPRSPEASQSSVWSPEPSPRRSVSTLPSNPPSLLGSPTSRLKQLTSSRKTRPPSRGTQGSSGPNPSPGPRRPSSGSRNRATNGGQTGSVRSAPPQNLASPDSGSGLMALSESKLAMTPENIRPLLENAREVHARCGECIVELRALLAANAPLVPTDSAESPATAVSPTNPNT